MRTLLSIIQENGTGINSKKTGSNLCELHITESLTNCDFYGIIQRREALALHLAAAGFKIGKVNGK